MIVVKGDDGVVIIDTLESCEVAKEVREAFEEVREGPVEIVCWNFSAIRIWANIVKAGWITNSEWN